MLEVIFWRAFQDFRRFCIHSFYGFKVLIWIERIKKWHKGQDQLNRVVYHPKIVLERNRVDRRCMTRRCLGEKFMTGLYMTPCTFELLPTGLRKKVFLIFLVDSWTLAKQINVHNLWFLLSCRLVFRLVISSGSDVKENIDHQKFPRFSNIYVAPFWYCLDCAALLFIELFCINTA